MMGLETRKGSSCSVSMYLCPALKTLTCGRQTTRVPGMEAWLWYQLRTVPGMSPQMMVLGEGMLSLGRNTQQDCSSNWREGRTQSDQSGVSGKPTLTCLGHQTGFSSSFLVWKRAFGFESGSEKKLKSQHVMDAAGLRLPIFTCCGGACCYSALVHTWLTQFQTVLWFNSNQPHSQNHSGFCRLLWCFVNTGKGLFWFLLY